MTPGRILAQLLRYGLTGGAAAIVDLGVFAILCPAHLAVAPAAVLSFLIAAGVNYRLTSRFVFGQCAGSRAFVRFLGFAGVGLLFNVLISVVAAAAGAPPVIAKATGIGAAFLFNFWLNAAFVFRPARQG